MLSCFGFGDKDHREYIWDTMVKGIVNTSTTITLVIAIGFGLLFRKSILYHNRTIKIGFHYNLTLRDKCFHSRYADSSSISLSSLQYNKVYLVMFLTVGATIFDDVHGTLGWTK